MNTYVIGDIQGCYDPLQRLLDKADFNDREDCLWLVGDLVNRGPQSLQVLRFLKNLTSPPIITLGNHDLHLLGRIFTANGFKGHDDTLTEVLAADDVQELGHWLRNQKILHHCPSWNAVMTHAGIAPCWDLPTAIACAKELETVLQGDDYVAYLQQMYGNEPAQWSEDLQGLPRLRLITNYFTRMRFCDTNAGLLLDYKGTIKETPPGFYPWFSVPSRKPIDADILFGHWAALEGKCPVENIYALDTGCVWGKTLTALRLNDKKCFSVSP